MLNYPQKTSLLDVDLVLTKADIKEKMRVANLGCGSNGYFTFKLSELVGKHGQVYVVDILKEVLAAIDKEAGINCVNNIKAIWSDLEVFGAAKIEADSLDVALLINTLHQSQDRQEMLREATRLLKKDGRLVIVEWKTFASPLGPIAETKIDQGFLISLAKKLGLYLQEEFEPGQYHYGLVFVKA